MEKLNVSFEFETKNEWFDFIEKLSKQSFVNNVPIIKIISKHPEFDLKEMVNSYFDSNTPWMMCSNIWIEVRSKKTSKEVQKFIKENNYDRNYKLNYVK